MTKITDIPAIRFKGFSDTWEQRKLGDMLVSLQNNTLSRVDLSSETGIAKNVHYGDVLIKFGEILDVRKESLPMISDESVLTKYKASFLQNGDVIVADTAEDSTVGKCSEIAGLNDELVLSGLHTIPYRPIEKFASGYLGYYLNSSAYHNQLIPLMQGIKVTSISKSAMQNTEIVFPKSVKEQGKIGVYFTTLDHLITLHQRKYDKLTNIKKSMLEKMFPQNGSNVPEIRFKGFTEAWEQRKAKDLCSISTGKSNTQDRVDDGVYPFYVRSPIVEHSNRYLFDEEAVLTVGDGVGTGKVFHYVNGKYDLHQRVYRMFDFSEEITAKYFYYYFSNHFYDRVMAMTAKTSVDSVRYEMIADMDIALPKVKEQMAISAYFERLDSLITLHQRELEKLKNLKKACLEKMFV